jgi:hypothetical protein
MMYCHLLRQYMLLVRRRFAIEAVKALVYLFLLFISRAGFVGAVKGVKNVYKECDIHAQMRTSPHFFRPKLNGLASKSRERLDHEPRAHDRFFGSTEE